jgi:hypothetical protein
MHDRGLSSTLGWLFYFFIFNFTLLIVIKAKAWKASKLEVVSDKEFRQYRSIQYNYLWRCFVYMKNKSSLQVFLHPTFCLRRSPRYFRSQVTPLVITAVAFHYPTYNDSDLKPFASRPYVYHSLKPTSSASRRSTSSLRQGRRRTEFLSHLWWAALASVAVNFLPPSKRTTLPQIPPWMTPWLSL